MIAACTHVLASTPIPIRFEACWPFAGFQGTADSGDTHNRGAGATIGNHIRNVRMASASGLRLQNRSFKLPDPLEELVELAGPRLGQRLTYKEHVASLAPWHALGKELLELLCAKNGFFAYERALLVRPLHGTGDVLGALEWNSPELWKATYDLDMSEVLFFAEDVFGNQYGIRQKDVCYFYAETGDFAHVSDSLRGWCRAVLNDAAVRTSHPLARCWQAENGPIPGGHRLAPKLPFVCGGTYSIDNLYLTRDLKAMQFYGSIASQIRHVPDGGSIRFKITE